MPTQNLNPDYQQHVRKLDSIVTRDLGFVTIIDISSNRKPSTPNQVDRSDEVSAREEYIQRLRRDQCDPSSNSDLIDQAAENLARDMMIQRLRRGKHGTMAEFSEQEARQKYLERLQQRKR